MFHDLGGHAAASLDAADPVYRRWLRRRLVNGNAAGWIIESGGAPVASGIVWIKPVQPRPGAPRGRVPYLMSMFTEPAHRGKGHAPRIVKAALAWCKAEGHEKLELHASEFGRPVYEKLGFERSWEMRKKL